MYVINPKYSGGYTLARDAILHGVQITYTPEGVITYQSFGLDKKLSNPFGLLNFFGAGNQNRTDDLVITNDVLYRLSHTSKPSYLDDLYIIPNKNGFVKSFF